MNIKSEKLYLENFVVLCLGRTKFKNRWVVSWCRVCLDLVGRGGLSSMIIHAACPLLVPIRKCESHDVVGNSLLNRIKRLFQVTGMMLPSLRHRDNVLLPPPLLHTDPFLLDNILDVSAIKKQRTLLLQYFAIFPKTPLKTSLLHFQLFFSSFIFLLFFRYLLFLSFFLFYFSLFFCSLLLLSSNFIFFL